MGIRDRDKERPHLARPDDEKTEKPHKKILEVNDRSAVFTALPYACKCHSILRGNGEKSNDRLRVQYLLPQITYG